MSEMQIRNAAASAVRYETHTKPVGQFSGGPWLSAVGMPSERGTGISRSLQKA